MKLRNIKAHFILDTELAFDCLRKIFRDCDATFTIHRHHKNVVHVTGVKSKSHLNKCADFIACTFNVKIIDLVIDNQFFSHKDNKSLDLRKIYEKLAKLYNYNVVLEPELSPALLIKNKKEKDFPTILLFRTGSYTFMGGKMDNVKSTNSFIKNLIEENLYK